MLNLATLLDNSARTVPDRTALVLGVQSTTYAELDAAARRVAGLLRSRGIGPGDKVALSCPNIAWFPVVYYGILKAGAVVVPLNVLLKSREIAYHLADSGARAYFCFEGGADLPMGREGWSGFHATPGCEEFLLMTAAPTGRSPIEGAETLTAALAGRSADFETVATEPGDTAVILYTSGTTGQPKGAELSHSNLMLNVLTCHKLFGEAGHDVHLVALPLFHSFGQVVQMNAGIASQATLVLLPRFDAPSALALMQRHAVTFFGGVPTMYWALLEAEAPDVDPARIAANLRLAVSGGSALPVEIHRRFSECFGVTVLEGYGLSETSPVATFVPRGEQVRPGSIGRPVWGVEVDLVDRDWVPVRGADAIGEIVVRGHNVMKGYHNRPEATAEVMRDGWFRTGDLARRDADGWFSIVDRAKDMILRGGFNVYPREIEEVLLAHPSVSMAAVIGVPHDRHGEEVKACVVRTPGATLTEDGLIAWCKQEMAGYKYPRIVEFLGTLPTNATGKILKRELRDAAGHTPGSGR
ncbi:long-chain-fatty-acid--CoA ligase [Streptomyces sp. NBC_00385]|uniref:long-chain-fatty-acid--CoA ligase n=1 Tax=Streptomyces sp. NBC_00385 TaxID=2975733 RepID=UPI002DDC02E6|nr:long-chain fatty acid--CoA ligase [Streptomyces sp. NBC_00385]WRZ02003.1 long-chain fatty acid--CoA ligase [Streptomyces sp. NBC_00385]